MSLSQTGACPIYPIDRLIIAPEPLSQLSSLPIIALSTLHSKSPGRSIAAFLQQLHHKEAERSVSRGRIDSRRLSADRFGHSPLSTTDAGPGNLTPILAYSHTTPSHHARPSTLGSTPSNLRPPLSPSSFARSHRRGAREHLSPDSLSSPGCSLMQAGALAQSRERRSANKA